MKKISAVIFLKSSNDAKDNNKWTFCKHFIMAMKVISLKCSKMMHKVTRSFGIDSHDY